MLIRALEPLDGIAVMERPSPDVVRNVEEVLANKLANYTEHSSGDTLAGGVVPLVNILNRSNPTTGMAILERLEQTDIDLADEVRRRMFVFEDIVTLDDRSVQMVLREVDAKQLAVALKGVRDDVRQATLRIRLAEKRCREIARLLARQRRDLDLALVEVAAQLPPQVAELPQRGARLDVFAAVRRDEQHRRKRRRTLGRRR